MNQMHSLYPSFFKPEVLECISQKRHGDYIQEAPFPHIVMDNFLPEDLLDRVIDEFPNPSQIGWTNLAHAHSKKLACNDETCMGDLTRALLHQLNSSVFISFLERLTGIQSLIPDPHFIGGGLHQIERGGHLGIHADFNYHERLKLDRRLNLLLYLNKDWKEEYGGHLELWKHDMSQCEKKILPIFNRLVIFSTTDDSFHGHPEPLTCPLGRSRKSLALYYYTNGRPPIEQSEAHSTLYKCSASNKMRKIFNPKIFVQDLIPPIFIKFIRQIKYKFKSSYD